MPPTFRHQAVVSPMPEGSSPAPGHIPPPGELPTARPSLPAHSVSEAASASRPGASATNSLPRRARRHTHAYSSASHPHHSSLEMNQSYGDGLRLGRPRPAAPIADMHQAHYDRFQTSQDLPSTDNTSSPPNLHSHNLDHSAPADRDESHSDLIRGLNALAQKDPSAPLNQQRSPGETATDHVEPHSTPVTIHQAPGSTHNISSRPPAPTWPRSYTESYATGSSPPSSHWHRIRRRLSSISSSFHEDQRDVRPHFSGAGWGGRHQIHTITGSPQSSTETDGNTSSQQPESSSQSAIPIRNDNHVHRNSVWGRHHHRQSTLPLTGAPGFSPHSDATLASHAAAVWAAEELRRGGERRRGIPVRLTGRTADDALTQNDPTVSGKSDLSASGGVISPWLAAQLQARLPARLRMGDEWKLIYSSDQHGVSLKTMYTLTDNFFNPIILRDSSERTPTPFATLDEQLSAHVSRKEERSTAQAPPNSSNRRAAPSRSYSVPVQRSPGATNPPGDTLVSPTPPIRHRTRHHHLSATINTSEAGLILAIRDMEGHVFGAFVHSRLHVAPHYYGSGETFLWKVVPNTDARDVNGGEDQPVPTNKLVTYSWTAQNDFVILSEANFLSIGFGATEKSRGGYGLWLDDAFTHGSSARCATFDNDILCSSEVPTQPAHVGDREEQQFECFQAELWAVGLSS